ncbi:MAG: terminase [Pseudomonadota bacterium]
MTAEERAEVEKILAADKAIWRPQPGPQLDAFASLADVTGYGGAAGGGKSDLMCGLSLTQHKRTVIFRREKAQTERVVQRLTELRGTTDGYNGQKGIWQLGAGQLIEFGGLDNPGDERRWQGRDHDLKAYDEVTEMREAQVRYTMGWNRSADPHQRVRVLMTFNPPTNAEGRWVIAYFAPWLDDKHPNPAKPGELRWFTTIGGVDQEVPDARPFVLEDGEPVYDFDPKAYRREQVIRPRSRTFISSRVTDNPYYMASGYIDTLQSMPEPLRSQMLNGDFTAGMEDDPWQVIPTAWVDAAQKRWTPRDAKGPMDSMGVDVARGGRDATVISRRHGVWFDEMIHQPGTTTPDGPTAAAYVIAARRDRSPVHIDIIGWGSSAHDFLVSNDVQTIGVNGSSGTDEKTADEAQLEFVNERALRWWRMREALNPMNPDPISLPNDPRLKADLCAPRWKLATRGIQVEEKAEIIKRLGRSPDDGDAAVMALIATVKNATSYENMTIPDYGTV